MENLETKIREEAKSAKSQCLGGQKSCLCWIIPVLILLIILLVVGVLYFFQWRTGLAELGKWQAVFLVNNQIYFGKIVKETKSVLVLREVYYLKEEVSSATATEKAATPRLTLVKLGEGEIHSPTDEMRINKAMVLLVETLKPTSEVVRAIEAFKTKK